MTLQNMNNSLKQYLNQATGISNKCRRKLICLVEKHFYVELPKDNYLNIDISILENGNIVMRDVEYKTNASINNNEELEERFNNFKVDVEELLNKNETNFKDMRRKNEVANLLIVLLYIIIALLIVGYSINELLIGNLRGFVWIVLIVFIYIIPSISNNIGDRFRRAFNFIKKMFK